MAIDKLAQLKAMHLYGMAAIWSEWLAEEARSLKYQLKAARFPAHRDLSGFDWKEAMVPRAQVEQLATAAFMETAHNIILVGGTGTGKTHLATAIGVSAVSSH